MSNQVEVQDLQPGDVYRTLFGRGERRLRRVKKVTPFSSGTVQYIQVLNVDPRTEDRETGAVSMVRGTVVERVQLLNDDDWDTHVLDIIEKLKDGETYTVWAVGSDLYA